MSTDIPDKSSFKAAEVCEIVQIPSYVLRTWENEFSDLGVTRTQGVPRGYRRRDVEMALRIKELVFTEHLTLAGVRRRLEQEKWIAPPPDPDADDQALAPLPGGHLTPPARATLSQVKEELRSLLESLARDAARGQVISADLPSGTRLVPGEQRLPGFDTDSAAQSTPAPASSETTPPIAPDASPSPAPARGAASNRRRQRDQKG